MMLTLKQPVHYGYRTVHDLPTPPSTSRASPPLTVQEPVQKPLPALPRKNSPPTTAMAAPHRALPMPAAMTLPQPSPAPIPVHPPASGPPLHSQGPPPPPPSHAQMLGGLPAPPQWQGQGPEDSMKTWLVAKTEEERRRQEEEKTRQEALRLEQRRLESDMLRTSLERGIPPAMVPVVFAGMAGGALPQVALEWAQQYLAPQHGHQPQLLPPSGPMSPDQRRDSTTQQYAPYGGSGGVPSTPGSAPGPQSGFVPYQGSGSPTRSRAHTLSSTGSVSRAPGSSLPRVGTGELAGGPAGSQAHASHALAQQQQATTQPETQSQGIYFHHWQPPASQGSSQQPATPSVDSPKKRKATGPQQAAPPPSTQPRYRSPPLIPSGGMSTLSNPPPGRRRGHSRQRSDVSGYRPSGRGRSESFGPNRAGSPGLTTPREGTAPEPGPQPRSGAHSVSSLLSDQPSPRYGGESRRDHYEAEAKRSPTSSDENGRGRAAGSAHPRERDNE